MSAPATASRCIAPAMRWCSSSWRRGNGWLSTEARQSTRLDLSWSTKEDSRARALPLQRFLLPWAARKAGREKIERKIPELAGGNWERGRQVFFSDEASCSKCHQVRGQGGAIGPDLSNLIHRDYASVLRDIQQPSAALNPDYLTYTAALFDGRTLTGTLRSGGDKLILGDNNGKEHSLEQKQIESLLMSPVSIMPEGMDRKLGTERMRDLLTFLLTEPKK